MLPQQAQNLAIPPALRHRPVGRLERAHRLRPLPAPRRTLPPGIGLLSLARRGRALVLGRGLRGCGGGGRADAPLGRLLRRGRVGGGLRGPVVDVPVVFVEEEVVLLELGGGHGDEVGGGEGGEEEVGF